MRNIKNGTLQDRLQNWNARHREQKGIVAPQDSEQ